MGNGPGGATRPASAWGTLPRFGRALLDVLPLCGRWETWTIAAAPCAANYGARRLVEIAGLDMSGHVPMPGRFRFETEFLLFWGITCALSAAGILLLIPLCEGKRGLQFRFAGRHLGAAALAVAILLAGRAVINWGLPNFTSGMVRQWWLITRLLDVRVPLAVWIAYGRVEATDGRRAPGAGELCLPGLVAGLLTLTVPSYAVPAGWKAVDWGWAWGHADVSILFFVLYTFLAVVGQAWLLRTWILGREVPR